MRIRIAAVVLGMVVLGLLALWWPDSSITNYPSSGTSIVAFGDSLVAGYGATEGRDFVSVLSDRLGVPIVNLGHNGDTTQAALARVDAVLSADPKVVLLLLGGNDYLRRVPQEVTRENLGAIIEAIQSDGAVVLLLGVRGGVLRDGYSAMYESLAEDYGTAYVPDVLDGLLGNRTYMYDAVHPNDAGHAYIAQRVAPVLKRLIE